MIELEISEYWRLAKELTVLQAVCLVAGIDPDSSDAVNCESWKPNERPKGYNAVKAAITHAILSKELEATIRREAWERGWDEEPSAGLAYTKDFVIAADDLDPSPSVAARGLIYHTAPDWELTTVKVETLKAWLVAQGYRKGYFFPEPTEQPTTPEYLNRKHPRYAPKLAAAISAWEATSDPGAKSPKQALMKWLREHAAEYGMTDDEGKPNETGIEEAAKIANWQPGGGAPKTPGE